MLFLCLFFVLFYYHFLGSTIISQRQTSISARTKEIRLVRDVGGSGDGYGITLRSSSSATGGGESNTKNGRSFIITYVKPNSPADRYNIIFLYERKRTIAGAERASRSKHSITALCNFMFF